MPRLVLIVEDDEDLRPEMVEYLERRGFSVKGCGSLGDARRALQDALTNAAPPGWVICDIGLPDGDGFQLLQEFAALLPTTRWFLMSGSHDVERLENELRSHSGSHRPTVIEKPFAMRALHQFVGEH